MRSFSLTKERVGLLVVDMQEKLAARVACYPEVLQQILKTIKGFQVMGRPIAVTEQNPIGLGPTITPIRDLLGADQEFLPKTTFSCLGDQAVKKQLLDSSVEQWVVVGIEAHVCVLQTAKDLLAAGKGVVVLSDAVSSRSTVDFLSALNELRDGGVRVSSVETILFEILRDYKSPEFKQISRLFR